MESPTYLMASEMMQQVRKELSEPLSLLADLDLDIHKGNSLLRMLGRRATMDDVAAGSFVQSHPDEALQLFQTLKLCGRNGTYARAQCDVWAGETPV